MALAPGPIKGNSLQTSLSFDRYNLNEIPIPTRALDVGYFMCIVVYENNDIWPHIEEKPGSRLHNIPIHKKINKTQEDRLLRYIKCTFLILQLPFKINRLIRIMKDWVNEQAE